MEADDNTEADDKIEAQEIFTRLDEIVEEVGSLIKLYCRGFDYKGDPAQHQFVAFGDDVLPRGFFTEFSDFITEYNPCTVQVYTTADHPHVRLGFDPERIAGDPSEYANNNRDWRTSNRYANEGECINCACDTANARPPFTLKKCSEKLDGNLMCVGSATETMEVKLCFRCSSGKTTTVARETDSFYVVGNEVVAVDYGDGNIVSAEGGVGDDYVDDVINILESLELAHLF